MAVVLDFGNTNEALALSARHSRADARLKESAKGAANRGSVFSFDDFRRLVTTVFADVADKHDIHFPDFMLQRFMAVSLLLGALRSEQFERFRSGGLGSIEFLRDNKDENHYIGQNNNRGFAGC